MTEPPADESGIDGLIDRIRQAESPPEADGDLTFEAPWQARAFGITLALFRQGDFEWEEFQSRLAAEIEATEAVSTEAESVESAYYRQWLAALERLVTDMALAEADEIEARVAEFAAGDRDASEFVAGEHGSGHDHDHDHPHNHGH